jgi:glycerophosphoryl diester phosphodiesterase
MSRLVYAHRGGAALAPENTMAAFARGMAEGADGLEFDVRLSRDGVPVVHHDPTLERTTDARGPVSRRPGTACFPFADRASACRRSTRSCADSPMCA